MKRCSAPSIESRLQSSRSQRPSIASSLSPVTRIVGRFMPAERRRERLLCVVAAVALIAGCTGGFRRPISCNQVESLRLGMSANAVREVLGQVTGELTQTDRLIDAANYGGIPGYRAHGIETHYMIYHDKKMWSARQDTVWAVLYQDKLFSVRAHRQYPALPPIEAFVLERDPRDQESAITRRRGPAFTAVFPCKASE